MSSTNQQIKKVALARLGPIPEDNAEKAELAQKIWDEIEHLKKVLEDAQWSGNTDRVKSLMYPIMVKRTMFRIVGKRPRR